MNKQFDFIGFCPDKELAGKKYTEWLPIYEQELEQMTYNDKNAILYLNDVCILSLIYSRLNLWDRLENLADKIGNLCHEIKEFEDDAVYLSIYLKSKLYRERRQLLLYKDSLREMTKYAIKHDKKLLMCVLLNLWGNFFTSLDHPDLALLFYAYSLDFSHQNYIYFSENYPEIAYYPISNILDHIVDDNERYDILEKLYNDPSFDYFTRIYFGDRLLVYSYSQQKEFDKTKYEDLLIEVFGDLNHLSIGDRLLDYYMKDDMSGLNSFYAQHNDEFDAQNHFMYYALSNCEDKTTKIKKWLNNDTFRNWLNVLSSYMDDLPKADKDIYFVQFVDFLRNSFSTINYADSNGFINYLESEESMFSRKQVGLLMLDHAGDNGLYTFAEELVLEMIPYCQFRKGNCWLSDAIIETKVGETIIQQEIIQACIKVLDELCCFEYKYPTIQSNFEVCQTILEKSENGERDFINKEITIKNNEFKNSPSWRLFARASYSEQNEIPKLDDISEGGNSRFTSNTDIDTDIVEDEPQYEDFLFMKDNPYYKELKAEMESRGWELDEKDLNINILHVYFGDDYYLLYLFYSPIPAWLGDEERFNDEDPLWFSERSHQISPVWRIRNYMDNRNIKENDVTHYPIVVMLPPTYVINGEDMKDSWDDGLRVVVTKYRELMSYIERHDFLPKETNYKEVSNSQISYEKTTESDYTIDEIDIKDFGNKNKNKNDIIEEKVAKEQADNKIKKKIDEIKEIKTEQINDRINDPWNLSQVYKVWKSTPYQRDKMGNNTSKTSDGSYDLTGLGLLRVVNAFLYELSETPETQMLANHIEDAVIGLYFKNTSVKFRLTTDWHSKLRETNLREFIIDSFNDERWEFINTIDRNFGCLDGSDLYFRGNLVSKLFETVIRIRNTYADGFSYIDSPEDEEKKLAIVGEIFNRQLSQDVWEQGVSGVSAPILIDVVKREAEKTAKTAIMSRNMSHNLGSHVMAYLKRDLGSVGDIIRKGVLHDFYPLPDFFSANESGEKKCDVKELMKRIETYTKEVEMPFLVGLGKFISYLQERQDYIATVATFYIPYFSAVNFKDDIYDTINPDYRYLRHSDRRGNRPENILMKYIALSEGLSRDITQQGPRKNDIVIRFRKFDGTNDYLFQKQRQKTIPNGPGKGDLNDMRQYSFYLPGGIVGRQALFTILENLIRNSAKHGLWRQKHNLEFTFDLHSGRDFTTNPHSNELYNFLKDEPGWIDIFSSVDNILNKFYILTLTDNLDIDDSSFNSLKKSIKEEYVSAETGKMINKHKGIKEIRISAAWMRGIADDLNIPSDEPPVVTVRKINNSLQYIFCVLAPKKVLLLADDKEELRQLQTVIKTWEGWYTDSIDHYKKTNDKSYDIIVLRNVSDLESLRPISSDRLVVAEDLFDNLINNIPKQKDSEVALYKKLYHIKDHDEPLLISDGKTGSPISTHIHLVSADAEVLTKGVTYSYCYRTHHQDPQEFFDYMNSTLRKHMNAVEGITGNNSTDRLIRNEKLDDVWYFKHLHALRTKVAIFDERMFSKVTGLEDKELTANPSPFVMGSRESVVYAQKRVWFFNVIYDEEQNLFNVYGLQGEYADGDGMYYGKITKVAEIVSKKIGMGELGVIPSISVIVYEDKYKKFANYISIHQGLMDKIYDAFKIKQKESYSEEVQKDSATVSLAMKTAMCSVSVRIYEAFYGGEEKNNNMKDDFEKLLEQFINGPGYWERRFCPGFFVHSGRSKPSEFDMPQKQPFIQYAAIENAAYDCKYSLVELLKSARYEPSE